MPPAHSPTNPPSSGKRAVNVSISADLVERARAAGINLSATLEAAIQRELRELQRSAWLSVNEAAIRAYNEGLDQDGVFSDGTRTF